MVSNARPHRENNLVGLFFNIKLTCFYLFRCLLFSLQVDFRKYGRQDYESRGRNER